jgi:hypothetical protein
MNRICTFFLKKTTFSLSLFLLIFVLSSCEKLFIEANPKSSPTENVKYLWTVLNEKYPFFEYKKINWDSVGNVWIPRANDSMGDVTVFRIMDSLLYNLKDGHTNLYGAFNFSRNWEWYLNYPDNYNANIVERNYLKGVQWYTGPFVHRFLDSNRIGYVRYSSFSNDISDFSIDIIVNRFQSTKGLIIDLRNNGGGAVSNVSKFMSRFIDKKTLVWKEAEKRGAGKNDLTAFEEEYVEPEGDKKYLKPIILLTNRRCYSATTLFVTAMLNLSNVKTLGDWTGGGGGTPTSTQLPNGWIVRYSGTVTLAPNGFNIENGVPPTIKQDISKTDDANGIDSIIERALAELK